jgi:hypothetical protein
MEVFNFCNLIKGAKIYEQMFYVVLLELATLMRIGGVELGKT